MPECLFGMPRETSKEQTVRIIMMLIRNDDDNDGRQEHLTGLCMLVDLFRSMARQAPGKQGRLFLPVARQASRLQSNLFCSMVGRHLTTGIFFSFRDGRAIESRKAGNLLHSFKDKLLKIRKHLLLCCRQALFPGRLLSDSG